MHMTNAQAKALGIKIPPHINRPRDDGCGSKHSNKTAVALTNSAFLAMCKAHGLPAPDAEYPFAPWEGGDGLCAAGSAHVGVYACRLCGAHRRRWRFDWLFDGWLAVEIVGGVWVRGHHSRGQDQVDDMEKYNHAVIEGYGVLQFTPQQITDGSAFPIIKQALRGDMP